MGGGWKSFGVHAKKAYIAVNQPFRAILVRAPKEKKKAAEERCPRQWKNDPEALWSSLGLPPVTGPECKVLDHRKISKEELGFSPVPSQLLQERLQRPLLVCATASKAVCGGWLPPSRFWRSCQQHYPG